MNPIRIKGAKIFGAPRDWDPAVDGECIGLPVIVNDRSHISVWKFTDAERASIAKGWNMALSVVGSQPPVLPMVVDVDGEIVRFEGDEVQSEPAPKKLKITAWHVLEDFWAPWFKMFAPSASAKR
jgi:hypothetical protein